MSQKKIKDLTLLQANQYCITRNCDEGCPFNDIENGQCYLDLLAGFDLLKDKEFLELLEKEVEVNE